MTNRQNIEEAFNNLLEGYLNSNHRKKIDVIQKAYNFALHAHQDEIRPSGEPYMAHPIAVATIASQEMGLGSTSICAALLHDVLENTDYTIDDIRNIFGEKIAMIVDGLTKIAGGIFGDKAQTQAENFKKLLLTMSEDIRVILIKICDRLDNMRHLDKQPEAKRYKIAGETLYIYAPLANRLGLNSIKTELEDLSFKYEHPEEYKEFTAMFQKAYDGDMTFIQTNFFFLMEMFSFNGVKGMMKIVASLFPGNKHYQQSLMGSDDNPLKGRLSEMLDSSLNNEAIRERLLHKNPYLFSLYYWIIFDNGFLHAADLISQTFLKPESPYWEKLIGRRCVEALIGASIDKAHYSKAQWKEVTQKLKKGETKQVIDAALLEVQGRRGRKSTYVILEEMLPSEDATILIGEIQKVLSEWKQVDDADIILPYIFAALMKGSLTNEEYNYRTFHAAMREKFPDFHIREGFNWAEAVYNAIVSEDNSGNLDVSDAQIRRGRKYATGIKLRLLSAINPNIN